MHNLEHIIAIVEPTNRDDSTVELARDVVAKGGRATVIMLITDRVRKDIRDFADAEDLAISDAEVMAIDRLSHDYITSIGAGRTDVVISAGSAVSTAAQPAFAQATSIAVGPQALSPQALQRLVGSASVPVIVAPQRAA